MGFDHDGFAFIEVNIRLFASSTMFAYEFKVDSCGG